MKNIKGNLSKNREFSKQVPFAVEPPAALPGGRKTLVAEPTHLPHIGLLRPALIPISHHCVLDSSADFTATHLVHTCPDFGHPDQRTRLPIDDAMDYSYSDDDIPNLIGTDDDDDGGGLSVLDGRRTPPDFRQHLDAIRMGDLSGANKSRQISFSCLDEQLPVTIQSLLMELSNTEDTRDLSANLDSIIGTTGGSDRDAVLPDDLARWSN